MALRHIFPQFINKIVQVSLSNGQVFEGIFKYDGNLDIFAIIPTNKLTKIKYAEVYFDRESIIHIREIYDADYINEWENNQKDSILNDIKQALEDLFKRN